MRIRGYARLLVALLLSVLAGFVALAQVPQQPPPLATPPPEAPQPTPKPGAPGLSDRAELEAFFDGVIAAQKEANHIEGVTIAVVANGELFFAKGYGFADKASGTKVDPERTMFRVGSVSKLFAWTAVMQLVAQGKLDLKADVNRYLAGSPVRIPDTFPQPVTLTHLLTHTPGFEDAVIGLFRQSPAFVRPLGETLAAAMPLRVWPPGRFSSYSNYGTALAGYLVERVSGMPYERYVEKRILEPLEMRHTTARQPLPRELAGTLATGYRWTGGEHKPQPFEYVPQAPAGAVSASAVDMAHFMIAHLQDGRHGQARILEEDTARQMRTRLFGHVPALNGMLHGFIEMNRNGRRIHGHGGDTLWFHSALALLPDENVGIFVSHNTDSGSPARTALVEAFLDRYFPDPSPSRARTTKLREPAGTFAGTYRVMRLSYRSLAKVAGLLQVVKVTELPDGRLLTTMMGNDPQRWVEVAPMTFREADGAERMAFLKDAQGRATHLVVDFPAIALERLGVLESPALHYSVIAVSLLVLFSAVTAWPIGAWRHRPRRTAEEQRLAVPPYQPVPRWGRLVLWLAALFLVLFVVLLVISLADPMQIVFGVPPLLRAALALPIAAAPLTLAALVFLALAWRRRYWRPRGRLYYAIVAVAAVTLLVVLNHWRLLGYHLQ